MLLSGVFDPPAVKANLEICLKGREQNPSDHNNSNKWLVNWSDWSDNAISDKIKRWKDAGCVASEAQLKFTACVICYMEIVHRALFGHNSKPNPVPFAFPWFGPIFVPPSIEYREAIQPSTICASHPFEDTLQKSYLRNHSVLNNPGQFLIEPVYVISPAFFPNLGLDQCPVSGCTAKTKKRGFTSTGPRSVYGVEYNLKAIGLEYQCVDHGIFSTMSSDRFWKDIQPWQCDNIPFFQERSACTRELFDLVVELRPRLSIGGIYETIRQLHIQYDRRLEKRWLASALAEKERYPERIVKDFPTKMLTLVSGAVKKINPSPSETFFRDMYDFFINKQRREESSQYTKTLAGLAIGMDATIKIAKKANVYVSSPDAKENKMKVINFFDGGLLTGVNEDKELVICELLSTASSSEMIPPLREFADRCNDLGVSFKTIGEVCVDRCCSFRSSLQIAVPNIVVSQDLAHLKNRIMETVLKKSFHRKTLGAEISTALIMQASVKKGVPPLYHSPSQQAANLSQLWNKYSSILGVWTTESETVFAQQIKHASNGCLQRRDPMRMSTTSYNENVHKQLNRLSVGHASSLTTIEGLIMDAMLRYNLKIQINNQSQPANSPSRRFRQKSEGSHHLFLLDHILQQRKRLTGVDQPSFIKIRPDHNFVLVERESGPSISKRYSEINRHLCSNQEEDDGVEQLKKQEDEDDEGFIFSSTTLEDEDSVLQMPAEESTTASMQPPSVPGVTLSSSTLSLSVKRVSEFDESPNKIRILESTSRSGNLNFTESTSLVDPMEIMEVSPTSIPLPPTDSLPVILPSSPLLNALPSSGSLNVGLPSSPLLNALPSSGSLNVGSEPHVGIDIVESLNIPETSSVKALDTSLSLPSTVTSATLSSFSPSRSMKTYSQRTNQDTATILSGRIIQQGTSGYWRFCALRIQEQWISTMSNSQWVHASQVYNNSDTFIHSMYYGYHPFPCDPVQRDPYTLKDFCQEHEDRVRQWKADQELGKETSEWKKMQISLPIPDRTVTISKQGRKMKPKICQRCKKLKDGQGSANHPRDHCDDGFPIWIRVPHPLPNGLGEQLKEKKTVNPAVCIQFFKMLVDVPVESQQAEHDDFHVHRKMENLQIFEGLARRSEFAHLTLQQAVLKGVEVYCFDSYRFKK